MFAFSKSSRGIGNTRYVFTWYWIDTKICSIAQHYCLQSNVPFYCKMFFNCQ